MAQPQKLPKQWKNWCAKRRLRPSGNQGRGANWAYLAGKGHYWRIDADGFFAVGDTYADFSFERTSHCASTEMPTTYKEFQQAIDLLLATAPLP